VGVVELDLGATDLAIVADDLGSESDS